MFLNLRTQTLLWHFALLLLILVGFESFDADISVQQLLSWQVLKLDEASGYSVQCTMTWKDITSAKKAMSESAEIMTDGPNYSTVKPLALFGSVVGESVKA